MMKLTKADCNWGVKHRNLRSADANCSCAPATGLDKTLQSLYLCQMKCPYFSIRLNIMSKAQKDWEPRTY